MLEFSKDLSGFMMDRIVNLDNFKIVEYYPYTSVVTLRIVEENHNYKTKFDEWLDALWEQISECLTKVHKIMVDNKVAVKLVVKDEVFSWREEGNYFNGGVLYVGRYDGKVSIGLGVYQPWNHTKEYNKKFE